MGRFTRIEDKEYLEWVRLQPCIICGWSKGKNSVHHVGDGIHSKRANDHLVVPLCDRTWNRECPNCHHEEVHKHPKKHRAMLRLTAIIMYNKYLQEKEMTL